MLPNTARGINPAASTIPAAMLQNRNAISIGSLIAVRKRTMESAPHHAEREHNIAGHCKDQECRYQVSATRVAPNAAEYISPQ